MELGTSLIADKGDAGAGGKLDIGNLPVVGTPVHITGDEMPIAEDALHHGHMPKAISTLHPWLKVYNISWGGRAGDVPVVIVGARRPGPGIRICGPRHIDAVQLMEALIGPPCTLSIGEIVARALSRWWRIATTASMRGTLSSARNTNGLVNVDDVGVRDVVVGGESLPARIIAGRYRTQRIPTPHTVALIAAGARGLGKSSQNMHAHQCYRAIEAPE